MAALHTCARLSGTSISGWEPCPTRYHSVAEGPLPVAFRSCHGAPGRVSSVGIALSAKPEANHFPVKNSISHLSGESPWVPASAAMPLASSEPAPLIYYFVFLPDDNENLYVDLPGMLFCDSIFFHLPLIGHGHPFTLPSRGGEQTRG